MQKVLNNILRKIRPTQEEKERMKKFSGEVMKISEEICKTYHARPMLCGSVTKNTWLSNKNELDLFILFSTGVNKKNLGAHGMEIAKAIIEKFSGGYEIAYAEHPYVRGMIKFDGGFFDIDIVPCYDLKGARKIITSVDRTPHHVKFVKENLKMPDEVRLLKQFLKAKGIYGADVMTQGFSGYLCELMIINHGKFERLVKDASKWRAPVAIDLKGSIDADKAFKEYKSPLIVIDPVDPKRNVAAAVSIESFYRFVEACNKLSRKPDEKMFEIKKSKPYSIYEINKEVEKRGTKWFMIEFEKPDIVNDTLWPQLRRCMKSIEKIIESNGFSIMRNDFYCKEKCILVYEMDTWIVPKIAKNTGPNVYSRHAEDFLKHYNNYKIFIENENWIVEKERKYTDIFILLNSIVKSSKAELLRIGIPNKIAENFRNSKIYSEKDFEKMPEEFNVFMKEWFEKDIDLQS